MSEGGRGGAIRGLLTRPERFAKAIHAGTNMFSGEADPAHLVRAVRDGLVTEAELDRSVTFLLREMFDLGLFEHPLTDRRNLDEIGSRAHHEVARRHQLINRRHGRQTVVPVR